MKKTKQFWPEHLLHGQRDTKSIYYIIEIAFFELLSLIDIDILSPLDKKGVFSIREKIHEKHTSNDNRSVTKLCNVQGRNAVAVTRLTIFSAKVPVAETKVRSLKAILETVSKTPEFSSATAHKVFLNRASKKQFRWYSTSADH